MTSSGSRCLHSRAPPQSGFQGSNCIAQQKEGLAPSDGNDCLLPQERVVLASYLFSGGLGVNGRFVRYLPPQGRCTDYFFPRLWILPEILCSLPALLTISETYPRTVPRFTALIVTMSPGRVAIVRVSVCLSFKGDEFFISSPYASYTVHRALSLGSCC